MYCFVSLANPSVGRWVPKEYRPPAQARNGWNPAVLGNTLFGLHMDGAYSHLSAYEINTRKLLWQAEIFGYSDSPLIVGGMVIVSGQNEVAAYYAPDVVNSGATLYQ